MASRFQEATQAKHAIKNALEEYVQEKIKRSHDDPA